MTIRELFKKYEGQISEFYIQDCVMDSWDWDYVDEVGKEMLVAMDGSSYYRIHEDAVIKPIIDRTGAFMVDAYIMMDDNRPVEVEGFICQNRGFSIES